MKKKLANEIVRLMAIFFPLTFFNKLTIKCVVGFWWVSVKISKDPCQLMVEIGLASRYYVCD